MSVFFQEIFSANIKSKRFNKNIFPFTQTQKPAAEEEEKKSCSWDKWNFLFGFKAFFSSFISSENLFWVKQNNPSELFLKLSRAPEKWKIESSRKFSSFFGLVHVRLDGFVFARRRTLLLLISEHYVRSTEFLIRNSCHTHSRVIIHLSIYKCLSWDLCLHPIWTVGVSSCCCSCLERTCEVFALANEICCLVFSCCSAFFVPNCEGKLRNHTKSSPNLAFIEWSLSFSVFVLIPLEQLRRRIMQKKKLSSKTAFISILECFRVENCAWNNIMKMKLLVYRVNPQRLIIIIW